MIQLFHNRHTYVVTNDINFMKAIFFSLLYAGDFELQYDFFWKFYSSMRALILVRRCPWQNVNKHDDYKKS